jgi:hypothetical protein
MKDNNSYRQVAFQIGTDMIGQPKYMVHDISNQKGKFGIRNIRVEASIQIG